MSTQSKIKENKKSTISNICVYQRFLTNIPNIGDIIVLRTINHKLKVIDNTPKLFIKVERLEIGNYTSIFGLYELGLL